ncbi:MAG TPA: DUF3460 family protein [Burkholderiales bacterium]|nr:DUF3460 family protein [Burkholderiales bacterium]
MHAITYESDLTRLLRGVVESNPAVEESQRRGRGMFWDKRLDFEEQRRKAESERPMLPYEYAPGFPQPVARKVRHPILPATD